MLVLPAVSVIAEFMLTEGAAGWLPLIGKWIAFWSVGIRLLVAGLRQVIRPGLTADLLGVKDASANVLVRELGFGNLAIGTTAALTLTLPNWTLAAAMCGSLFYGLQGCSMCSARTERARKTGRWSRTSRFSSCWPFTSGSACCNDRP